MTCNGLHFFFAEIQELRHKSQSAGDSADASTTTIIDQSLMTLDERLESVEKGIKNINETLEPLLRIAATPTVSENGTASENAAILRKHSTLLSEWESVQDESEVLREELKEDKWLTVFRTVTDQADGMMSSLEKAVNRCQVRDTILGVTCTNFNARNLYGKFIGGAQKNFNPMLPYHRLEVINRL